MAGQNNADASIISQHWQTLCGEIGPRFAGSENEQRAADYIEQHFRALGLDNVGQHRFDFPGWDFSHCAVTAGHGERMQPVKSARPICYSPGTPAQGVRGELVYLESDYDFERDLRGKIGLLIGSLALGDPAVRQRLEQAKLAGLATVDSRVPYEWPINSGAAPQWLEGFSIPLIGISYFEAHGLVKQLPLEMNITIKARTFPDASQNVLGEVAGTARPEQVIVVSSHHDTVRDVVGADDNASGVVCVLELARLFAGSKPRRTLRFVTYGVEERLSVGAYLYMRSLRPAERKRLVLALNADSIAGHVGTDMAYVSGGPRLEKLVRDCWARRQHQVEIKRELSPYSDHFPLNICGVPSVWLTRPTTMLGYWALHSEHDRLENVSSEVLARTVNSAAALLDKIANAPKLAFPRRLDPATMREVRKLARREYRHPWSPEGYQYPE